MGRLRLIFNGDDYGGALSINAAVIRAHEGGVLTSASLMVTGDAVADAVRRAQEHPTLAVGLHVVVMGGRSLQPVLPAGQVPHLVDAKGHLPRNPFLAGVRYFLNPIVRAELRREISAQFERFRETGLPLAHVDGHYFMHMHPVVSAVLIPLAEQYGAPGIRLARDDLRLSLSLDRQRLAGKITWATLYGLLCRLAERRLRRSPLTVTDRAYGLLQLGRMHEPFVVGLLRGIDPAVRTAELYFHPCTQRVDSPFGPNPGDLQALLSPRVRRAVQERGAQLTNYPALHASRHAAEPVPLYGSA